MATQPGNPQAIAAMVTPVVLVGGQSRRFGRDKLREPIAPGVWLVDRAIGALREVFGPRVAAVGACDAGVAARFDAVIADRYPGVGPVGGVLSALEAAGDGGAVFVLSGDLPAISARVVREVLHAACSRGGQDQERDFVAVMAYSTAVEPCIGLYLAGAAPLLSVAMEASSDARGVGASLHRAIPASRRIEVKVDPVLVRNANTPDELTSR